MAKTNPKHKHIADSMRAKILNGTYAKGAQLPTEAELVKRLAVSRPTVGRALRELQQEGLLERRAGAGTFVRRERVVSGGLWGLIIPGLGNTEIFEPICAEIARLARLHEYSLLWNGGVKEDLPPDDQAMQLCAECLERKVAGVYFVPLELTAHKDEINTRIAESLKRSGIAVVLLDRDLYDFPKRSTFDVVGLDNNAAAFVVTDHLIKLGCRKLCFVARPWSASTVEMRISGFREALTRNGLSVLAPNVKIGDPDDREFALAIAKQSDGVVCANDHTAALLMRSFEALGVKVPKNVRMAGFDDTRYATLLSTPLTTMHQPCGAIGAAAVRAMLDRIKDPTLPPRQILLSAELAVRASCGSSL